MFYRYLKQRLRKFFILWVYCYSTCTQRFLWPSSHHWTSPRACSWGRAKLASVLAAVRTAVWPMLCYVSCALMHFALGNSPSSDLFRPTCSLASFQSTNKQTTTCCWHCYEERRPAYCTTSEIIKYKTCKKLKFTKLVEFNDSTTLISIFGMTKEYRDRIFQ